MLFQGYLIKSPPQAAADASNWIKHWRKRWFVLRGLASDGSEAATPGDAVGHVLEYFFDHTLEEQKGSISMSSVTEVREYPDSKKHDFLFSVVTPTREYFLSAPSKEKLTAWLENLRPLAGKGKAVVAEEKDLDHPDEEQQDPPPATSEAAAAQDKLEEPPVVIGHGNVAPLSGQLTDVPLHDVSLITTQEDAERYAKELWTAIEGSCGKESTRIEDKTHNWKVVRVFVSSTFTDFFWEREVLVRKVFPKLRAKCAQRRLRLIECDLRWGVPKESTSESVFRACLGELDRCIADNGNPFFINLLGGRYGWAPSIHQVPEAVQQQYDWPLGASITLMEILHGAYRTRNPNAAFFIRSDDVLSEIPAEHKHHWVDQAPFHAAALKEAKSRIRARFPEQSFDYNCTYAGIESQAGKINVDGAETTGLTKVALSDLNDFADSVYAFLEKAIDEQYPEPDAPLSIEESMSAPHEDFLMHHTRSFIGRADKLEQVMSYITSDGESTAPMLLIEDHIGQGKSSLLAKVAQQARAQGVKVVFHSTAVSADATDALNLVTRIGLALANAEELQDLIGASGTDLMLQRASMVFKRVLDRYKESGSTLPQCVVIVDGISSLHTDERCSIPPADIFPAELPPHFRVVLSSEPNPPRDSVTLLDALKQKDPAPIQMQMEPVPETDRKLMATSFLGEFNKTLDEEQLELIAENQGSATPGWLRLACDELRLFGLFERVTERIRLLPAEVPSLMNQVLARMHEDDPARHLYNALGLLAASRNGLDENQLIRLLGFMRAPEAGARVAEAGAPVAEVAAESSGDGGTAAEEESAPREDQSDPCLFRFAVQRGALPMAMWAQVYPCLQLFTHSYGGVAIRLRESMREQVLEFLGKEPPPIGNRQRRTDTGMRTFSNDYLLVVHDFSTILYKFSQLSDSDMSTADKLFVYERIGRKKDVLVLLRLQSNIVSFNERATALRLILCGHPLLQDPKEKERICNRCSMQKSPQGWHLYQCCALCHKHLGGTMLQMGKEANPNDQFQKQLMGCSRCNHSGHFGAFGANQNNPNRFVQCYSCKSQAPYNFTYPAMRCFNCGMLQTGSKTCGNLLC